ncbi:MAG TPA: hypothetical protein VKR06_25155 [Ktedonosporobacter sp.]|nr:hypothetical protein [Ktedonosporobacter sp.]
MSSPDPRPTFREAREKHQIELYEMVSDIDVSISEEAIKIFDRTGQGVSYVVDACLDSLSRLSGVEYSREMVGGIRLLPTPHKVPGTER